MGGGFYAGLAMTVKETQQAPKGRSEWLCYVALILTNGFFAFIWVLLLANDVNRAAKRPIFPTTALAVGLAATLAIYLSLVFFPRTVAAELDIPQRSLTAAMFVLGSSLLVLLVFLITLIHRKAKLALGETFTVRDTFATIGLSIVMFVSLIMVQQRANRLLGASGLYATSPSSTSHPTAG